MKKLYVLFQNITEGRLFIEETEDDNFTYQTTPTTNTIKDKEQKNEEEVTEFQLESEVVSHKENIQNYLPNNINI